VRKYELQLKRGDAWETFASGTTIGKNAEIPFESVTAQQVRLNILGATDSPTICEFQLFSLKGSK
jgi:hypothetical protein